MKRKITWLCILALLVNNIWFFEPVNILAEEEITEAAETAGESEETAEEGERPEGMEPVMVPVEPVENDGERPEGIEPVMVPVDPVTPEENGDRPEGVEPVMVPVEPVPEGSDPKEEEEAELPEGVEKYVVPTTPVEEVSENEAETVSENESVSSDEAVSDNKTVSENVSENSTVSDDDINDEVSKNSVSVDFPKTGEDDHSLDFIVDPYELIKKTEAAHYEGREFQEGAHLFFENRDRLTEDENGETAGEIHYSNTSDPKTIRNSGDVPVKIHLKVKADFTASENGGIEICEDPSFKETDYPAAALSIRDGNGKETYLNNEGGFEDEYELEPEEEMTFAVHGTINKDSDWSTVSEGIALEVSYEAEPIIEETEEESKEEKKEEKDKDDENKDEKAEVTEEKDTVSEDEPSEKQDGEDEHPEDQEKADEPEKDSPGEGQDEEILRGGLKGSSIFEGRLDEGIYSVEIPVYRENMFTFRMDPQKLIDKTNGAAYPGKTFEKGQTLYFRNIDRDSKYDYSSMTDLQRIVNKGTIPVKLSVSLSIADDSGVDLSAEKDFRDYPFSQLFLSIVSGNGSTLEDVVYTKEGVSFETVLPALDQEISGVKWEKGRGYSYRVVSSDEIDEEPDYPRFEFRLTGSTNEEADWNDLKEEDLTVNVFWSIQKLKAVKDENGEVTYEPLYK